LVVAPEKEVTVAPTNAPVTGANSVKVAIIGIGTPETRSATGVVSAASRIISLLMPP
jgi:hypothetical protein